MSQEGYSKYVTSHESCTLVFCFNEVMQGSKIFTTMEVTNINNTGADLQSHFGLIMHLAC